MKKSIRFLYLLILLAVIIPLSSGNAVAQTTLDGTITIVGTIVKFSKILTDEGKVYEIGLNSKGSDLSEMIGQKMLIKGRKTELSKITIILVSSFEAVKPVPNKTS